MQRIFLMAIMPNLLAVLLGTLVLTAPAAAAAESTQCSSQSCFKQAFRQCQPVTFMTRGGFGAQAKYAIEGKAADGCRLSLTFVKNPNPAWVDKPVTFVLDPAKSLDTQIEAAVPACLAGSGGNFHCDGPLAGITDGTIATSESAEAMSAGTPCGQAVTVSSEPLYPLPRDGKWGYVNRAGDWVIEPQWRQASYFSEGRAAVEAPRGWGIIDRSGNYVLEPFVRTGRTSGPAYSSPVGPFSEGCAVVHGDRQSDYYFISRNGQTWLPEVLDTRELRGLGAFSDGKAWFALDGKGFGKPERHGWIDADGNIVIKPKFAGAGNFVDGLAPAAAEKGFWGYINGSGEFVWPRKQNLRHAYAFSDGLARVSFGDINDTPRYHNQAYVRAKDWAFDDAYLATTGSAQKSKGKQDNTVPMDKAGAFSDGLAPIVALPYPDTRLFYVGTTGHIVLTPGELLGQPICNRSQLPEFHHGLARLSVPDKGTTCGEPVLHHNAYVRENAHYIYIDTQGRVMLEEPFHAGDTTAQPDGA